MKRIVTAIYCASMVVGASAASGVQIYGLIDAGIAKGNGGSSINQGGNSTNSSWQIKQAAASRIGFRGIEDLGGGLTAGFDLQHRFSTDTGTGFDAFFMQSILSIAHQDYGTLWMGRDYVPMFWVALRGDPFGMDGAAQVGYDALFADFTSRPNATRSNNTLGVKSKRFDGLSFDLAHSFGEKSENSQSGFNVQYQTSQLYAGLGYAKLMSDVPQASTSDLKNDEMVSIAFNYFLNDWRLIFSSAYAKNKHHQSTSKFYTAGFDKPLGSGKLKAAYYVLNDENNIKDRHKLGIGYDYYLSKLTMLYADFGIAKQEKKSTNSIIHLGIRKSF